MTKRRRHVSPLLDTELAKLQRLTAKIVRAQAKRPEVKEVAGALVLALYAAKVGFSDRDPSALAARKGVAAFAARYAASLLDAPATIVTGKAWRALLEAHVHITLDWCEKQRDPTSAHPVAAKRLFNELPRIGLPGPLPEPWPPSGDAVALLAREIGEIADREGADPYFALGRTTLRLAGFSNETLKTWFSADNRRAKRERDEQGEKMRAMRATLARLKKMRTAGESRPGLDVDAAIAKTEEALSFFDTFGASGSVNVAIHRSRIRRRKTH